MGMPPSRQRHRQVFSQLTTPQKAVSPESRVAIGTMTTLTTLKAYLAFGSQQKKGGL